MLTANKVLNAIQSGRESHCIDGRDYSRLVEFFPIADWPIFSLSLKEGVDISEITIKKWTLDNVVAQLEEDVRFGFEKALDQRSISSGLMYEVVKMWLWILEDDLQSFDEYAQYGLPLFKAVAVKYNFKDEISGDKGDEEKYSSIC